MTTEALKLTPETVRSYILGKQGLYPGRRFEGKAGTALAIANSRAIQVDTISVVARNHELALWSRVAGYQPQFLQELLYTDRLFFEYGHILCIYPLQQFENWLAIMRRNTAWHERRVSQHADIIQEVKERVDREGPLSSRDFTGRKIVPGGFNVVKDISHAFYYLYMCGEMMTHSRRSIDRVYQLSAKLIELPTEIPAPEEAEYALALNTLHDCALATPADLARRLTVVLQRRVSPVQAGQLLARMEAEQLAQWAYFEPENRKPEKLYFPASDLPILELLQRQQLPPEWQPVGTTTEEEVNIIAPLDNAIWDRARLLRLFNYDYVWEVYKPAPVRRWGYYTMPVLYGNRLVARLDPKLERKTGKLTILGFWLDDPTLAESAPFSRALRNGLESFARFHGAKELDTTIIEKVLHLPPLSAAARISPI